jgi:hypothetical protein
MPLRIIELTRKQFSTRVQMTLQRPIRVTTIAEGRSKKTHELWTTLSWHPLQVWEESELA